MAETKIQIAVVLGDNGEYACGKYTGEDTDWGFLADMVGVYDDKRREMIYPKAEKKYVVTAFMEPPAIEAVEAHQVDSV